MWKSSFDFCWCNSIQPCPFTITAKRPAIFKKAIYQDNSLNRNKKHPTLTVFAVETNDHIETVSRPQQKHYLSPKHPHRHNLLSILHDFFNTTVAWIPFTSHLPRFRSATRTRRGNLDLTP